MQTRPIIYFSDRTGPAEFDCNCACPVDDAELLLPVGLTGETDCNCACPVDPESGARLEEWQPGLLHAAAGIRRYDLTGGYQAVFNPLGPLPVTVLNRPALDVLDRFASPRPSVDTDPRAVRALCAAGLLRPATCAGDAPHLAPAALTVWLHLTTRCNLHCAYCYAPRRPQTMSPETARAAVQAVFRSALLQRFGMVKLKYAGGEPTLAPGLVRLLHNEAQAAARQSGIRLAEVLLSNGTTLSERMVAYLAAEKIGLMLSLDGIGPVHDRQRAGADGAGSFSRLEAALSRALQAGLRPHLSITITSLNVARLEETAAFALDRGLTFSLNFYRSPARLASDPLYPDPQQLVQAVKSVFALLEARQLETSFTSALDLANLFQPRETPCGLGKSYLAVTPSGQVAACQMELEHPIADIYQPDPLETVRALAGEDNPPVGRRPSCATCDWRYWCAGGCPRLRNSAPGYCQVYQTLLPELARLEGQRILRARVTPPPTAPRC